MVNPLISCCHSQNYEVCGHSFNCSLQFPFQNETTEDTHTGSNSNPTHFPSSKDSQDFSTFMSSNGDEQDSSLAVGKAGESDGTEHETVSLLKKRIAELTAEKEELKEIAEAQKAQVNYTHASFLL